MDIRTFLKQQYEITPKKIDVLDGGYRNTCYKVIAQSKEYVFIIYKKERDILNTITSAHVVASILHKSAFPTRIPIKSRTSKEIVFYRRQDGLHYAALYFYLPGNTIPWEAYTRRHLKSMGKVMSDMHYTLRSIKNEKLRMKKWDDETRKEMKDISMYLMKVNPWIEKKLHIKLNEKRITRSLQYLIPEVANYKHNILHYDFVRGNILFSNSLHSELDIYPITGILDFEKVCIGPEIADIARTVSFLIVDCKYKSEETVKKRFLDSGYEKRGKNQLGFSPQDKIFEKLLIFFWLRDFWKFLEHNPYESLYLNEHFVRTRNILMQRKILKYIKAS